MIFSFRRIAWTFTEGALIITGVAVVLFLLFYAVPEAPVGEKQGKILQEFSHYANELSFVSIAGELEETKDWKSWFSVRIGTTDVVFKWPYLGRSENTNQRVSEMIFDAIPETITLIAATLLIALVFGVLFGVLMARFEQPILRSLITLITSSSLAIPSFVFAIFVAWFFGYVLGDISGLDLTGSLFVYDIRQGTEVMHLKNVLLPAWALSLRPTAIIAQLMESKLTEIYHKDYIRTARSNGLSETTILWRHALPNALSTLISSIGSWIVSLIIGGVFVEFIFGWKGFGHLVIDAVKYNDFRLIMGITLVVSVTYIFVNAILEFLYPFFDPTLRGR